MNTLEVQNLGLIDYKAALVAQEEAVALVSSHRESEKILVCQHPAVITVGRALGSENEVFATKLPVFEVSRGGRATLHLPGQVVVYPVLDLKKRGRDLHAYMRLLETSIIETLSDFSIRAKSVSGKTGVWVGEKKIASLGVAVKNWVSYHGLALNVACDLSLFSQLSPCGFSSDVMTSVMRELSETYKSEWKIEPQSLIKKVQTRLIENLRAMLEEEKS